MTRRYPIGAEPHAGGTHFRVWAPRSATVSLEWSEVGQAPRVVPLTASGDGYHEGDVPEVRPGARYRYRLEQGAFPDPASRAQPEGPHGPSQVVDTTFAWTDAEWRAQLTPERFEFWQNGPDRLHDRIEYVPSRGGWRRRRLAP